MADFTRLLVWQRAQSLTVAVYHATVRVDARRFPGVVSQMRRAAASIGANIVEGSAQQSAAQFARFLSIAIASASELQQHIDLARRLGMIAPTRCDALEREAVIVRRMLLALRKHVQHRTHG